MKDLPHMQKTRNKKILTIIPAYNEEERIGQVVKKISESYHDTDIVVIDDGSRDRTARHAKQAGAGVIRLSSNMGYGVALQTGYKYAFERGYDYLAQLDGDGQHDPAYLPDLLKVVMSGKADLVLGSRFLKKSASTSGALPKQKSHGARRLGIRLFSYLTSKLVGLNITDPTSGYQAFNRRVVIFFIQDFFPCDFPDADVILMVHRAGFNIKELSMAMGNRLSGKSMHRGIRPLYYVFKMLLSMFISLLREKPARIDSRGGEPI